MTGITRLTDIQLVLLATAAQRANGSLLPPPETLGDGPARIRKAVQSLIRRGLAVEADLAAGADAWRTDGDRVIGVVITVAGRAAISGESNGEEVTLILNVAAQEPSTAHVPASDVAQARMPTKTDTVLGLMRRDEGATLGELVDATGWLPHTTRAALTGLRKKGHGIDRRKRGEVSCYHIVQAA